MRVCVRASACVFAAGWWQDFDLWGEDVIIHRRALRSAYRVDDPSQADYFLVPVWDSSAMWQVRPSIHASTRPSVRASIVPMCGSSGVCQMNWGFRDLLPTGVRVHKEAAEYIQQHWCRGRGCHSRHAAMLLLRRCSKARLLSG